MALTLRTLLADYPYHRPLKDGRVSSPRLAFDFAGVAAVHTAFKRVVREAEFDVAELALVTYLQAKAHGKPLVLAPMVLFNQPYPQHAAILCHAKRPLRPQDLAGRRIGVRTSSVTTVMWVRGILQNAYALDPDRVEWITFEDSHVAETVEPAYVHRAPPGKELMQMLFDGELDAAVALGPNDLKDPRVLPVIPDVNAAAARWHAEHGFVPVNHMLVVKETLSQREPWAVREVFRLLIESRRAAGLPAGLLPVGVEANRKALQTAIDYSLQQQLIPRRLEVDDLFDGVTRSLGTEGGG
jgi:4,5-dihydroxyphthalate decarboxylase